MNSNRAARDGDRARGPKYLPPGQLCAFGSWLAKAHERGLPVIVEAPPSNASGEHAIEGRFRQRAGTVYSLIAQLLR